MQKPAYAKRSFGQNYLIDRTYIDRIVGALSLVAEDNLIEIGSGRGALTEALIASGANVAAVEIDRDLHPVLMERFGALQNFRLIADDVLQVDIPALLQSIGIAGHAKLVGNLPYNISTAILQRVIDHRPLFSLAVFMFQREVVARIAAQPGSSERGFLTVMTEAAFDAARLFDVPPEAFSPRPKVWSSVVSLTPKAKNAADEPAFRRLVSMAFAQKRKTLLNNLRAFSPAAAAALSDADIDPRRRAETLTLEEWFRLYDRFVRAEST